MSDSSPWDSPQPDPSTGSPPTMASRHPYVTVPFISKRVSFYKSGDPQFSALKMVINSRTFKTFDALLDSLSKKVPLPFGVRHITTPRGVHAVRNLEELEDGKAYICSDQKKVKPFDFEMATRKLPPWYGARPISARRRITQLARHNMGHLAKRRGSVMMRTPKKLTVFRNGDPGHRHTIVLHRKTTPTFESLLDYVSKMLQFHVVKLHTPDGRRVDGLTALVLCSGVVVAAGREHFKPGQYNVQKPTSHLHGQSTYSHVKHKELASRKTKFLPKSSKSRLFSPSSERYIVNQINNSVIGRYFGLPSNPVGSMETGTNTVLRSMEAETRTCTDDVGEDNHLVPSDDDIEKSFRINPDGSMTVEMKVRLTIKEEETVHWTTTLSRCSTANQLKEGCVSQIERSGDTPDSNYIPTKDTEKEPETHINDSNRDHCCLHKEHGRLYNHEVNGPEAESINVKCVRRASTPGARGVLKQVSVESIETVFETAAQQNVVETWTYIEEADSGQVTEECNVVRQGSSQLMPTPGIIGPGEVNCNSMQSTLKSSSVAEVLQIQSNGEEITETMLHIHEHQSYHDSFFPNTQYRVRSQSMYGSMHVQQASSDTGTCSFSTGHAVETQRPHTAAECLTERQPNTFSSLPSDLNTPLVTQSREMASLSNCETNTEPNYRNYFRMQPKGKKRLEPISVLAKENSELHHADRKKRKSSRSQKTSLKDTGSSKKQQEGITEKSRKAKGGVLVSAAHGKQTQNSSEKLEQNRQISKGTTHTWPLSEKTSELNNEKQLRAEKELNVGPGEPSPERPFNSSTNETSDITKALMRQKLMHTGQGGMKETKELKEHIALPTLRSSDAAVSEHVEHCPEKAHHKPSLVVFRRGSQDEIPPGVLETNGEVSKVNTAVALRLCCEGIDSKESLSHTSVLDRLSVVPDGDSRNAGESGHLKFTTGSVQKRTHGVSIRIPAKADEAFLSRTTELPEMRTVLLHLCQAIQAIWQSSQHKRPSRMEKSQSVPDFSPPVASTFGSSSKTVLALLPTLAASESVPDVSADKAEATGAGCTEVLKLMEALKKIASIEDEDELKADLTHLQNSTSCEIMQSWRAIQEYSDKAQNHTMLHNNSDYEFLCELCTGDHNNASEQPCSDPELTAKFGVSEQFQDKLSALVNGSGNCRNRDESQSRNCEEVNTVAELIANNKVHDISELIGEAGSYVAECNTKAEVLIEETLANREQARNVQEDTCCAEAGHSYSEDKISTGGWTCYIDRWAASSEENNNSVKEEELENDQKHKLNCVDYSSKQVVSVNEQIRCKKGKASSVRRVNSETQKAGSYMEERDDDDDEQHGSEQELGIFEEQIEHARKQSRSEKPYVSNRNAKTTSTKKQSHEKATISKEKASSIEATHRVNAHKSATDNVPAASETDDITNVSHLSDPNKGGEFMRDGAGVCVKDMKKKSNGVHSVHKDVVCEGDQRKHSSMRVTHPVRALRVSDGPATSFQIASSLAFSYDCKGNLSKEHEGSRVKEIKEMFLAKSNAEIHCGHKHLPCPNTSDLSDYRTETSDSWGYRSQTSVETSTESGEDDCGRKTIAKGYVRRTIERLYGKSEVCVKGTTGKRPRSGAKSKHKMSLGNNSVGSFTSESQEERTKITSDLSYFNAMGTPDAVHQSPQHATLSGHTATSPGVLSNTAEQQLLGDIPHTQQPAESEEIQGALEPKSAEAGDEDDVTYSHFRNHQSSVPVIPSPEELAQVAIPKCTYFSVPRAGESDPVQDDLGEKSKNGLTADKTGKSEQDTRICPTEEVAKQWSERNGTLPIMPDNKVHPVTKPLAPTSIMSQTASTARPIHEQDPLEMLYLACGQHCPIL